MKISNLDELSKFMKFYFSNKFEGIKKSEEEEVKATIKKSIKNIDGSIEKIKDIALAGLTSASYNYPESFTGNSKLILFIVDCLPEEDRKDLIIRYLRKTENIHGKKLVINTQILLSMLDYLPDELKVNVLTNARPVDLVRIMGEINRHTKLWVTLNTRYYKKYYKIFKQALAE